MKDPLFKTATVSETEVSVEKRSKRNLFNLKLFDIFRFLVPVPSVDRSIDQEQQDLDLAYMITELRKVYLYDAIHNAILLVALSCISIELWGIPIDARLVFLCFLGISLIFNQLPFILGQSALHQKVLERYEGIKRAEVAERLKKHAPLSPKSDSLAALFTTGTSGGILYFLLDRFVKETLK